MPRDPLIGLVGKPSSGKSTTLNSLTDATSKVGNFPFTTIDPQRAVGYLQVPCACARFVGTSTRCRPNYGSCTSGRRSVPIELLDVAGLVPGAHLGRGLGNKFLDDLRHADALIHVVDVSGTTDADGKATRGYDPTRDVEWLTAEIEKWIEGNLLKSWGGTKRKHVATKSSAADTLQNQLSGYGSTPRTVVATLDALAAEGQGAGSGGSKGAGSKGGGTTGASTSASAPPTTSALGPLETWDDAAVAHFVRAFVRTRFPTVLALNKIDHADADANITRIARAHAPERIVLTSAISEVFLRKLAKQNFIKYVEGGEFVDTRDDLIEQGDPDGGGLLPLDDKLRTRIENLKDLVLYRFGATGVVQALSRAAELLGLVPVFPVRNVHGLRVLGKDQGEDGGGEEEGPPGKEPIFRDCVLVKKGSTVRDVARKVVGDAPLAYVEGPGGVRVSEDDVVAVGRYDVLSFRIGR